MSLNGNLEHLPIVDVIQLIHGTRKSGILRIVGRKGESQLVFKEGYLVGASHLNNSLRIGDLLVERGVLTQDVLDRAVEEQSQAGRERRPLIVTLLEKGVVEAKEAYGALQALIEKTIVDILTWKKGTFELKDSLEMAPDDYRFYPESLSQEINVDTQGILMDALRLFDEKRRDGALAVESEEEAAELSADDLGLADLDQLERKIPGVFTSLDDRGSAGLSSPPPPKPGGAGSRGAQGGVEPSPLESRFEGAAAALSSCKTPPELSVVVMSYVAEVFARSLTLVVRGEELIADKGIGILAPKGEGATRPLGFRISLAPPSLLREAVQTGELFCGACDLVVKGHLFSQLGTPSSSKILLLPVRSFGQTVFVIFADFAGRAEMPVPVELLQKLSNQASAALEKLLYRK